MDSQYFKEDDLYNGKAGVALFWAALSKATQNKDWALKASKIIRTISSQSHSINYKSLCALGGLSSLIYVNLKLGQILNDPSQIKVCCLLLKHFQPKHIEKSDCLDFVGGISGFITTLLTCYRFLKDSFCLQLALKAGDCLLEKFQEKKTPQIGFSHGLAGYAYALFQLGAITKKKNYINEAKKMVDLEQSIYLKSEYRVQKISWCHGHTGIGLSRLFTLKLYDNEQIRKELSLTIQKTKESIGDESSLCCGDFGRFEFLMEYAKKEKIYELEMDVRKSLYFFMNEFLRTNSANTCFKTNYQWGFMQGLTGVGYSLLKLGGVCNLPQILLLK